MSIHGGRYDKEYTVWATMLKRCRNPKNKQYFRYGARGIKVCKRWYKYENFIADMGKRPMGGTLERINNAGNYEPKNCKWATVKEQSNNRRTNVFLTFGGQKLTVKQWAEKLGFNVHTLYKRIEKGWDTSKILNTPTRVKRITRTIEITTMRQIKFRAWTGAIMEYNVMVGKFGAFYANPGAKGDGLDPNDTACLTSFTTIYSTETPIMQFTGLHDKDGTEIYEGDILKTKESNPAVVEWQNRAWSFPGFGVFDKTRDNELNIYHFAAHGEVIGNIYENPELLK